VGYLCGARFHFRLIEFLQALGFIGFIFITSAGIGLLLGTLIHRVHGAVMTGVGLTVISAAISGVMTPYAFLPPVLQQFAKVYPLASANSSIIYLLVGPENAGYNPLSTSQILWTMSSSVFVFVVGMFMYSRYCWRKE
jgi:ABC-type polysaccharide/polyol phosphate export permease